MGPEHKRAIYDLKFVDRTIGIPVSDSSQGTKQLRPAICFVRRSAPLGPNSVGTVAANDEAPCATTQERRVSIARVSWRRLQASGGDEFRR